MFTVNDGIALVMITLVKYVGGSWYRLVDLVVQNVLVRMFCVGIFVR